MTRYQTAAGTLAPALVHFRKVTRSYWPGLFACYTVPELPRTNNDLEQFFGAYRYHDRRTTGRKVASPSLVLNGSFCVMAAAATRLHPYSAADLAPENMSRLGKSCGKHEKPAASSGTSAAALSPGSRIVSCEAGSELTPADFATLVFFNRRLMRTTKKWAKITRVI